MDHLIFQPQGYNGILQFRQEDPHRTDLLHLHLIPNHLPVTGMNVHIGQGSVICRSIRLQIGGNVHGIFLVKKGFMKLHNKDHTFLKMMLRKI